ncbi:MAG: SDR family NAD(P)-dependent oxidoreductase, partial [Acidimicrobiales bacterium]
MNLEGASALVTGGASGIGEASAEQLAALGARVVIADLNEEAGQAVASRLGGLFVKCDVSSEEDGQAAVAAAGEMGPLRALVNSAGLGRAGRTVDRNNDPMPQKDFDFVIRINLLGSFNMLRLSAAAMAKTDPVDADGARGAV